MQQNKFVVILAAVAVFFAVTTISSCVSSNKQKMKLTKEMSGRFDLERELNDLRKEKTGMEENAGALTKELADEKAARAIAEKMLKEEKMVNENLQDTLQKLTKLKDALEKDLKEALISGKSIPVRK